MRDRPEGTRRPPNHLVARRGTAEAQAAPVQGPDGEEGCGLRLTGPGKAVMGFKEKEKGQIGTL